MKRVLTMLAALTAFAVVPTGCAAPVSSDTVLTGTLRIKGNDPFPVAVLEVDGGRAWEVDGVPPAGLRHVAGKHVTVSGKVKRAPDDSMRMPIITIDSPKAVELR